MEIWQRMPTSNKIEGLFLTSISNFQFSIEIDFLPFVMPISPSKHVWIAKIIPLLLTKLFRFSNESDFNFAILSLLVGEIQVWKSSTLGLWQSKGIWPNDLGGTNIFWLFLIISNPCFITFGIKKSLVAPNPYWMDLKIS